MIQIDIEMPETCKECFAIDGIFCKASNYKRISYPELETKAKWCPLHEVTADPDTVSRKQAIEAIAELQGRAFSKGEFTGLSKAWQRIKKLPPSPTSSRPQIHCKDCK